MTDDMWRKGPHVSTSEKPFYPDSGNCSVLDVEIGAINGNSLLFRDSPLIRRSTNFGDLIFTPDSDSEPGCKVFFSFVERMY